VGGIPELAAGDDGVTLVAPADPNALAEALRERLSADAVAWPPGWSTPLAV
jgi:glycosyltransferase involved in cell wall biosynthesis